MRIRVSISCVRSLFSAVCGSLSVALLSGCAYTNHFLDEEEVELVSTEEVSLIQVSNVNTCTAYDVWTYINIHTGEYEVIEDDTEWIYAGDGTIRAAYEGDEPTIDWHIAIHRYEFKTNGAEVIDAGTTDITAVEELPDGTYTADEIATYEVEVEDDDGYTLYMDMSGMMSGNIGYAHYPQINRTLCGIIQRTATGSMPPYTYDADGEVFVLKWDDGTWGAIKVTATLHTEKSTTGYLSFYFKYVTAQ